MTFRKILCPVDFSPGSHRAVEVAVRLARESDAELELVHALYVPGVLYAGEYVVPPEDLQRMTEDARRALDATFGEAQKLGATRTSAKLLSGVPWSAIMDAAEDPAIDLLVVGTHGRTGLARVLLGSVTEKVVRHAPCSVLVVRPDSKVAPFDHVLCATDFSESSRHAMQLAGTLAQRGGHGITLLHVLEVPGGYTGEPHPPGLYRQLDRASAAVLDRWGSELRAVTDVPAQTRTRVGYAGAQTLAAIDADPTIDLVVVGTHGRTGLTRILLGSVAEKVIRHARCPVLVARHRT